MTVRTNNPSTLTRNRWRKWNTPHDRESNSTIFCGERGTLSRVRRWRWERERMLVQGREVKWLESKWSCSRLVSLLIIGESSSNKLRRKSKVRKFGRRKSDSCNNNVEKRRKGKQKGKRNEEWYSKNTLAISSTTLRTPNKKKDRQEREQWSVARNSRA